MLFTAPVLTENFVGQEFPKVDNPLKTEDFDFFNYLLGLQAENPLSNENLLEIKAEEGPTTDVPSGKGVEGETELLALFRNANSNVVQVSSEEAVGLAPDPNKVISDQDGEKVSINLDPWKAEIGLQNGKMESDLSGKLQTESSEKASHDLFSDQAKELDDLEVSQKQRSIEKYFNVIKPSESRVASENVETTEVNRWRNSTFDTWETKTDVDPAAAQADGTRGMAVSVGPNLVAAPESMPDLNVDTSKSQVMERSTVPELFERVQTVVHRGGGKMTVNLNPPELGQVAIEVATQGSNVAVKLASESEAARSIIEGGLGELRLSLQSQDLVVSKLEVDVMRDTNTAFDFESHWQRSDQTGENQTQHQGSNFNSREQSAYQLSQPINEEGLITQTTGMSIRPGSVDIRV